MVDRDSNVAADDIEHPADESTSLLHVSLPYVDHEISKRDTREPYILAAIKELKWMTSSSFLTAFALLLQQVIIFIDVVSVGHIGATELAAMTLAGTCFGVIALAPSTGMMSAMETFCSNAFTASHDKTAVGFHFQRGVIAVLVHMTFAIPIMWNGERILLAINQEPRVAELSGQYLRIQTLGIVPLSIFEACKCYLQSQEIMRGGTVVLLFVVPIHVAVNYLLVRSPTYGIGFRGAAIGDVFSECLMLVGILIYIRRSRAVETWGGWDSKALSNMFEFYRLAIPAVITVCSEWICFELLNIGSSYFGTKQLAATAITINTGALAYQISNGLGYSTSPRIGNLIGDGKPRQARIACDMAVLVAVGTGTLCLLFLMLCGRWWISVYTNDPEVVRETLKLMPVFCGFIICDALNAVLNSVMRGLGRQIVGAGSFIFSYYCIAVPLGLYLGYTKNMQARGLWLSISIAVIFSSLVQFAYAYMWVNWKDEVRRCLVRLQRSRGGQDEVSNNAGNL
ncbi:ethionine resistance protein [Coemansia guatemalensis]|uniref:Ethionine resistance protein n=1 Tax=Coemansia guatemalensis TaxID=2761395 RepID=A0A9W8HZU6_9FUNG|nr:ethionine resistance protein [Coemansia guatemalensis]